MLKVHKTPITKIVRLAYATFFLCASLTAFGAFQDYADGEKVRLTQTSLNPDKPPFLMETRFLPAPDGSAIKIQLAFPITDHKTNSQNIPYNSLTLPPGYQTLPSNGIVGAYPAGKQIILPSIIADESRIPKKAQLISVEQITTSKSPSTQNLGRANISVLEPKDTEVSRPRIQIKGVSDVPLQQVRFDISNANNYVTNIDAHITSSFFDTAAWDYTTNFFECMGVELALGTNHVRLRLEDVRGSHYEKNLVYVLRLDNDRIPPTMVVQWPDPSIEVSGNVFTLRGHVDDDSARVFGRIVADGQTNSVEAIVENDGRFWLENLPVAGKTNHVTLVAIDAAGNRSITNFIVLKSDKTLVIDPVPTIQLIQLQTTVTGKVSPSGQNVWVNGCRANVDTNGNWSVTGIALTPGGVAIFEAVAAPRLSRPPALLSDKPQVANIPAKESVAINASLGRNSMVLNAIQPTYGTFKLTLTGAAGRDYVLSSSINLVDWTPILTNLNSASKFEFVDTNLTLFGCRFFRITPMDSN